MSPGSLHWYYYLDLVSEPEWPCKVSFWLWLRLKTKGLQGISKCQAKPKESDTDYNHNAKAKMGHFTTEKVLEDKKSLICIIYCILHQSLLLLSSV